MRLIERGERESMFRRIIITLAAISMLGATIVSAQRPANRRAARQAEIASRRMDRIQQRLNLSDSQLNGIHALQENRRKEMESLQQEVQQKRQALRQLLQQPNPNPSEIGNATLALRDTRGRSRDINQRYQSGVKSLLTPDQQQRLPKRLQ